jgi:hypothetical protein
MKLGRLAALASGLLCAGCGVPYFDVPYDQFNQPTAKTIVQRLQCEIRDMVRDDRPDDPATFNRAWLLNSDFDVQIALSLEVTDSGGLAPSLSHVANLAGFTHVSTVTLGLGGSVSEARTHNFSENIQLSVRKIFIDWKSGHKLHDCPEADTNLAGTLGIKDFVALAASTPELVEPKSDKVFGGTVQFVVTKNLTSSGATFALVHFKSIAALANLSEINTDKITLSFAHGPNAGKPMPRITPVLRQAGFVSNSFNSRAYNFLQQQITSSITSQLIILQNSLR